MRAARVVPIVLALLAGARAAPGGQANAADTTKLVSFEQAIAADPEDLRLAADYRQLAIVLGQFDRSIDALERLAKRKGHGPNILISHALACVDKVPIAGDMRRLYLGRDAMDSLTKSIALKPTVLAYYIRGVVNLYYNNFIFKRIPRGIADLERALALTTPETPPTLHARVYTSLGDGHWRLEAKDKAKDVWARGAQRFPDDPGLKLRRLPDERDVANEVGAALYAGRRVDTTLRGVLP